MWILSAVVYAVVCSAAVLLQTHHFELIELALRCAILLPALVFAVRRDGSATAWSPPPWRAVAIPFAIVAALVSFALSRGIVEPDESAYRLQARIFASGHLMAAPLPGAAADVRQTPPAVYYEHHILTPRGWMTKYYPG